MQFALDCTALQKDIFPRGLFFIHCMSAQEQFKTLAPCIKSRLQRHFFLRENVPNVKSSCFTWIFAICVMRSQCRRELIHVFAKVRFLSPEEIESLRTSIQSPSNGTRERERKKSIFALLCLFHFLFLSSPPCTGLCKERERERERENHAPLSSDLVDEALGKEKRK